MNLQKILSVLALSAFVLSGCAKSEELTVESTSETICVTEANQKVSVLENVELTLPDFIYSTYNSLLESGWRMREIDEMDMLGFLRIRAWKARQDQARQEPVPRYIDEVWPNLKP